MNHPNPTLDTRCETYNADQTRVSLVRLKLPNQTDIDGTAASLKAIADPVRLRILLALEIEPLCVCELSSLLEMSMPAVSHHLRVLVQADLISVKKHGKFACYHPGQAGNSARVAPFLTGITRELVGGLR